MVDAEGLFGIDDAASMSQGNVRLIDDVSPDDEVQQEGNGNQGQLAAGRRCRVAEEKGKAARRLFPAARVLEGLMPCRAWRP